MPGFVCELLNFTCRYFTDWSARSHPGHANGALSMVLEGESWKLSFLHPPNPLEKADSDSRCHLTSDVRKGWSEGMVTNRRALLHSFLWSCLFWAAKQPYSWCLNSAHELRKILSFIFPFNCSLNSQENEKWPNFPSKTSQQSWWPRTVSKHKIPN